MVKRREGTSIAGRDQTTTARSQAARSSGQTDRQAATATAEYRKAVKYKIKEDSGETKFDSSPQEERVTSVFLSPLAIM